MTDDGSLDDLVEDINDNLELFEASLLEYEKTMGTPQENVSLVHIMFRYVHNSKGALSIIGQNHLSRLVHFVETHLDNIRNGRGAFTNEVLDASLKAVSLITRELAGEDLGEEIEGLCLRLEQALEASEAEAASSQAVVGFDLGEEQLALAKKALSAGKELYQVEKPIRTSTSDEELEQLGIFEDIAEVGDLIAFYPRNEQFDHSLPEQVLRIVFASEQPSDDLELFIFDPFKMVSLVGEEKAEGEVKPAQVADLEAEGRQETPLEADGDEQAGLRVLIVEDDYASQLVIKKYLDEWGRCDIANDGREGIIQFMLAHEEKKPYDLVCLDIMMPFIDGRKLLRLIRKVESDFEIYGLEGVKIVMTTALGDKRNIIESFNEGCEGYLTKPIVREPLEALLRKLGLIKGASSEQSFSQVSL